MEYYDSFRVGANTAVLREGKILLGKRKNCFGSGNWGLPGGHLEMKEALIDAAKRELLEETGLVAHTLEFANVVNDYQREGHHIQFLFVAKSISGEPELREPGLCDEWRWFNLENLPENLFIAHKKSIELFKTNTGPFSDS